MLLYVGNTTCSTQGTYFPVVRAYTFMHMGRIITVHIRLTYFYLNVILG